MSEVNNNIEGGKLEKSGRKENGQFVEGHIGIGGRPLNNRSITAEIRKLMDMTLDARKRFRPKDGWELAAQRLVDHATDESGNLDYHELHALMDRLDGKPAQTIKQDVTLTEGRGKLLEALRADPGQIQQEAK